MAKRSILVTIIILLIGGAVLAWLLTRRSAPGPAPAAETAPPPVAASLAPGASADPFEKARMAMVADQIAARGVAQQAVLDAMSQVPRQRFVPEDLVNQAYNDHPLPIGYGQTISQPYIVALMTEALEPEPGDRVLEIGTGSGYQAAVLAALGAEIFTIEIIPELAQRAEEALRNTGYPNVQVRAADGYFGWPEHAPYDAIIVTAAPDHLPPQLADQLKEGGRLVIPIGPQGAVQTLWLFEKRQGELQASNLGAVRFVPLTGAGH